MAATDLIYQSTKTYQHSAGFSCCFRQWRAESHCNQLHGYALKIELVFESELDERNWVVDFGGLKSIKGWLEETFDHRTLVAEDDPQLRMFEAMRDAGVLDLCIVPAVGCEKFAELIFQHIEEFWPDIGAKLQSVQVWEHEGNSAKVIRMSSVHSDWFSSHLLKEKRDLSPEEFRKLYQQEPTPTPILSNADVDKIEGRNG